MASSFLTLGDTGDGELSYFKQLLDVAQTKAENCGYAERRAQEMANACGDLDDYTLEGKLPAYINLNIRMNLTTCIEEVTLAMEEILEKEKDLKQLVQTS